jgi:hypothetical protein
VPDIITQAKTLSGESAPRSLRCIDVNESVECQSILGLASTGDPLLLAGAPLLLARLACYLPASKATSSALRQG